jgi:hypothetical protein
MSNQRLPVLALAAAVTAPGLATIVTYDSAGELTSRFALNTNNGVAVKYQQVASGGLGSSGAVDFLNTTDPNHTTAVFNESSFAFAGAGDSVTVSQFIKRQDAFVIQTPWTQLGIVSDLSERMDGGSAGNSYASVRLDPVQTPIATDVVLRIETKVNGGGRVRTTPAIPNISLVSGHWYFMAATFEYGSTTDIRVSTTLEDWGTDGAAFQSTVLAFSPTSIALSGADQINGDGSVWAGFRSFHEGGADLHDNFGVVPEPGTVVGLLIVGGAIAGLRRKLPSA